MKIYRYDVATADLCDDRKPWGTMHSSDTGEYVKYSDVERLQAEKERLREALEELTVACEKDFCSPITEGGEIPCADEDAVSGGIEGDDNITFGMIRRARAALSATGEGKV